MRRFLRRPTFRRGDGNLAAATVHCASQPQVIKLMSNGERKLLITHDHMGLTLVGIEWEVPNAQEFLDDVWACAQWVVHGDPEPKETAIDA